MYWVFYLNRNLGVKYILAIVIENISLNEDIAIIFLKKFHRHLLPRLPFLIGYQFTKLLLLLEHWSS